MRILVRQPLVCSINSKPKAVNLNGYFAHPFVVGVEELVIEPTLEISQRELSGLLRRPGARYIKNGTSKTII